MTLTGKIAFASGRSVDFDIWSMNLANGELKQITCGNNYNDFPRWSPDGSKIVFVSVEDDMIPSISVMNADGREKKRLTNKIYCQSPSWSADGSKILFTANAADPNEIEVCTISASGGKPEILFTRAGIESEPSWAPDGKAVVFAATALTKEGLSDRNADIWEYDLVGRNFRQLTNHPSKDYGPAYSPDGKKIAFISHRNQQNEAKYNAALKQIAGHVASGDISAVNEAILAIQKLEADGDVYVMNRDGSGVKQLTRDSKSDRGVCWSPCGKYLNVYFYFDRRPRI